MKSIRKAENPLLPRQQTNWDWRAAGNFIFGGMGGGFLLCAALASLHGVDVRPLIFVGLASVGLGLTCVWFEIGRPWRAMNVFKHVRTSWMTREAMVGSALFASGGLALLSAHPLFIGLTGLIGIGFVYAQARILAANKGIPAWRHPGCLPLVVVTGFTEGAGLLSIAALAYPPLAHVGLLLAMLATVRAVLWSAYKTRLWQGGAPAGTLKVFGDIHAPFVWGGNALAALLGLVGSATGYTALLALGGAIALLAGAWMKYALICRAAYTQGLAINKMPTRGLSLPKAGTKPGWQGGSGA